MLQNSEGLYHWHLQVHNFLSHLHFFKVGEKMLFKSFMLPVGHILDLYCVALSNAAPFSENYIKLYFDAKHLEKGWNRGGGIFGALFSKNCLSDQYRMLP